MTKKSKSKLKYMPRVGECRIDGCSRAILARQLCGMHYQRKTKRGDPCASVSFRAENGEPLRFYEEIVLNHEGSDCLIWPYANSRGYGRLFIHGHMQTVSRVLCEHVNGPPPSPDYDAAHSCGNGNKGCVTKAHMSWKTRSENMEDKKIHGTHQFGEKHTFAKLTDEQVIEIRALAKQASQSEIASRYGVKRATVSAIQRWKTWKHLQSSEVAGAI